MSGRGRGRDGGYSHDPSQQLMPHRPRGELHGLVKTKSLTTTKEAQAMLVMVAEAAAEEEAEVAEVVHQASQSLCSGQCNSFCQLRT